MSAIINEIYCYKFKFSGIDVKNYGHRVHRGECYNLCVLCDKFEKRIPLIEKRNQAY